MRTSRIYQTDLSILQCFEKFIRECTDTVQRLRPSVGESGRRRFQDGPNTQEQLKSEHMSQREKSRPLDGQSMLISMEVVSKTLLNEKEVSAYIPAGWGLGALETESHICRHICVKANVVVVDVDYRLVPEYPFPTGIYDCFSALQHVLSHPGEFEINSQIVTLGGVSAGANIALICNHLARDAEIPIKGVIVGTPTIGDISKYEKPEDAPYPSLKEMEFAPTLNWARLKWFDNLKWDSLAKNDLEKKAEQEKDVGWFKDAMEAPNCRGLADFTVIMTAECDPLRDEGEAYGRKIEQAGNKVVVKRFPGVPHPFQHMDAVLDQGKEFIRDTVRYVKSVQ